MENLVLWKKLTVSRKWWYTNFGNPSKFNYVVHLLYLYIVYWATLTAQPVIPLNLYSNVNEHNSLGSPGKYILNWFTMSIVHSSARPSGASRRSSIVRVVVLVVRVPSTIPHYPECRESQFDYEAPGSQHVRLAHVLLWTQLIIDNMNR